MKTKLLQLYLILCIIVGIFSCAPQAYPPGPNPLDLPGTTDPTAAELRTSHLRQITSNPAHP